LANSNNKSKRQTKVVLFGGFFPPFFIGVIPFWILALLGRFACFLRGGEKILD
jgi:hypothetical protein